MRIVFMGTPDIAAESLEALIAAGHNVVGVFTKEDKPIGRKQILTPPPVKVLSQKQGIPVFQPKTLRDGAALEIIKDLAPEVIIVVAYGKILPKEILDFPKFGCINGHASLLPKYRGSSPIQHCLVCGEEQTGITAMQMDEGIDTGDILYQKTLSIKKNENSEELFERLSRLAAKTLCETLELLAKGRLKPIPQNEAEATHAPMITKEMALIDFSESAEVVNNKIRGYYSWPTAHFFLDGKRVKVFRAEPCGETNKPCGTVIEAEKRLIIACKESALEILELQIEGSKRMSAEQFLAGRKIPINTILI